MLKSKILITSNTVPLDTNLQMKNKFPNEYWNLAFFSKK